jgi:PEP-CTERM putative exosortase interaction domain
MNSKIYALLISLTSTLCASAATVTYDGSGGTAFPFVDFNTDGKETIYLQSGNDITIKNYNVANGNALTPVTANGEFIRNQGATGSSLIFENCDIDSLSLANVKPFFLNGNGNNTITLSNTTFIASGGSSNLAWDARSAGDQIINIASSTFGTSGSRLGLNFLPSGSINSTGGTFSFNVYGTSSATSTAWLWDVNLSSAKGEDSTYQNSFNVGSYAEVYIQNFTVGSNDATGTASSTFKISGANSSISITGGLNVNKSGIVEFEVIDGEVSTLSSANVNVLDGLLILDFSAANLSKSTLGDEFKLISGAGSNWADIMAKLEGTADNEFVKVITQNTGDTWEIFADGNDLKITYYAIPEPSTYAAIFGALALAFAAYRKRK